LLYHLLRAKKSLSPMVSCLLSLSWSSCLSEPCKLVCSEHLFQESGGSWLIGSCNGLSRVCLSSSVSPSRLERWTNCNPTSKIPPTRCVAFALL
jgi:hypothetical protein